MAAGAYTFVIAGISLRNAFKTLKPAFPRGKTMRAKAFVVISSTPTRVTLGITGAAVGMPALTSGAFNAEIPFIEFADMATRSYEDGDLIKVELSPGCIQVLGITTRSPMIRVASQRPPGTAARSTSGKDTIINPLDAPIGLPLLAAYAYIRSNGIRPTLANQMFVQQQIEVDRLLNRAGKLLAPLGLSRSDLETVLDKRMAPRDPSDTEPAD